MKRRWTIVLLALLLASSLACTFLASSPRLVILLEPDPAAAWDEASLEEAREVIIRRLDSAGYSNADVSVLPEGQIEVRLGGVTDPGAVSALITDVGAITFNHSGVPLDVGTFVPEYCRVVLTDADIASVAVTEADWGDIMIVFQLTPQGAQTLADYSRENVGIFLVIARDGVVISSPHIAEPIMGGEVSIQGNFTRESAELLAGQFQGGVLPFPLIMVDTSIE